MVCLVLVAMNRANKTGPLRARFSSPAWAPDDTFQRGTTACCGCRTWEERSNHVPAARYEYASHNRCTQSSDRHASHAGVVGILRYGLRSHARRATSCAGTQLWRLKIPTLRVRDQEVAESLNAGDIL